MIKTAISILLAASILSSCSKEPKAPEGKVALQLSGSTHAMVVNRSVSAMPDGYSLGVYIPELDGNINTSTLAINKEYTSDGTSLTCSTPTYLELSKSYDIYSYSPYKSAVSDPEAIEFTHGEDLLWAPKTTISNVSESNCSANLAFMHQTSQVKFNVVVDPKFDSDDDSVPDNTELDASSSIKVTGFAPTATLKLTDGTLTLGSGTSPEIVATSKDTAGKYTLTTGDPVCFFIPSDGTKKDLTIVVTHAGINLTGTISRVWVAGESYTYTVTATKNSTVAILSMSATINDWINKTGDLIVD